VGVLIAFAVPPFLHQARGRIAKVQRNGFGALSFDNRIGLIQGTVGGIGFGSKRQVQHKLGKRLVADHVKPYPFVRPAILDIFDGGIAQKLFEGAVKETLKL